VTSPAFIHVAIASPLRQVFDYRPPAGSAPESLVAGVRVEVPFGNRKMIGILTGVSDSSDFPLEKIKLAHRIIDSEPLLDSNLMALYRWSSEYYQYPLGQVLQTSIPTQLRKGQPPEEKQPVLWRLTETGKATTPEQLKNAPRQQQLHALLSDQASLAAAQLSEALGKNSSSCLRAMEEKALVESFFPTPEKQEKSAKLYGDNKPLTLNNEQSVALSEIRKGEDAFSVFLLEGVTGSGKTEIYLQAMAGILQQGKQVLVLVPEISLTPQTVRRFQKRFNRNVAVFHSGLTDSERLAAWLQARNGKADIIIGTRSAIFTPMANPGMIIVDEEHDSSYKQQEGFRYSGRDLAIFRARELGIPVILGSATPSLESLNNALSGRYCYLTLTERAGEASHPSYRLLDIKGQPLTEGFSESLMDMIRGHLGSGNQVLVFLNRRGFAPILLCRHCGWIATCSRCETSYTLHKQPASLSCHHCDARKPVPLSCPECRSSDLAAMGMGTEKTEQTLTEFFPSVPVYRIDRDSTRHRDMLHDTLEKVDSGDPCILVGTQMLSKGHHFPNVTLVAILDADGGLFSADFRGQESMGQLLIQVAGRAGRGDQSGEVLIQTYNSTHPTLQALVKDGYGPFSRQLLEERKLGNLPPFSHMALIRAEANNRTLPDTFLKHIKSSITLDENQLSVIGPMPSPMEKRGGLFRMQLLLEAEKRSIIQHGLNQVLAKLDSAPDTRRVRWSIDVDPVDFT